MPAGSVIFIVIVAIWAAYLLQHWARRRENAAASRSVEGFSEAMRVLEKRPLLPASELRAPRPHSYAVTPARIARPTVDVKRAVPAGSPRTTSPLTARQGEGAPRAAVGARAEGQVRDDGLGPAGASDRGAASDGADTDTRDHAQHTPEPVEVASMSSHQSDRRHGARPVRASDQAPRPVVSRAQRRLRGLLLLAVVLWLPVSTALAVTGVLMWASVPFAALTLVAVLVWLRTEAQADRARAEDRAEEHAARRRPGRRPAPVLSSDDTQVIQAEPVVAAAPGAPTPAYSAAHSAAGASVAAPAAQAMTPARTGAAASEVAYDVWADEAERARLAESLTSPAASAAEPAAPGTWSPVPVPTPTYAMKAKAHPRLTESGIPADVFDTPEFADEADELDDRALFARRAVSQ